MDSDAVILANLQELWMHINPDSYFHWGYPCVLVLDFRVLNVERMEDIWNLVKILDLRAMRKRLDQLELDLLTEKRILEAEQAILVDEYMKE
jgi:hypothetical protein